VFAAYDSEERQAAVDGGNAGAWVGGLLAGGALMFVAAAPIESSSEPSWPRDQRPPARPLVRRPGRPARRGDPCTSSDATSFSDASKARRRERTHRSSVAERPSGKVAFRRGQSTEGVLGQPDFLAGGRRR
jgi:hypothetical protein